MKDLFCKIFGDNKDALVFFAPGRVNLIGEHIDYNGGEVFPVSLSIGTYAAIRKREDSIIQFYSENFSENGIIKADLKDYKNWEKLTDDNGKLIWCSYCMGVIKEIIENYKAFDKGFDVVYKGNIPNSSGLSSSASIEVLTAYFLKEMYDVDISMIDIAKVSMKAENDFIGMKCGIMDQFIIAVGKENCGVLLNTQTLKYEYVPIDLGDNSIVIINSKKKRNLSGSEYNTRRSQCEEALKIINNPAYECLCDMTVTEFEKVAAVISEKTIQNRARHAVYENKRTKDMVKALADKNYELCGKLLYESHYSLKDLYEVSCEEIDFLVEESKKIDGVIGARITGAGFGGCMVSIMKNDVIEDYTEIIGKAYKDKFNLDAEFYKVDIGSIKKLTV